MNQSDLGVSIAVQCGLGLGEARGVVDVVVQPFREALGRQEDVELFGVRRFAVRERAARTVPNPRTGDPIAVPGCRAVTFRLPKALTDAFG